MIKYTNKLPNKLKFQILISKKNNEYLKKNIMKISKVKPKNIFNYNITNETGSELNKILYSKIEKYELFILSFSQKSIKLKLNYVPLYPIFLEKGNIKILIISNILLQQLNGFNKNCSVQKEYIKDYFYRIQQTVGAIITNKEQKIIPFKKTMEGMNEENAKIPLNHYNILEVKNNYYYLKSNMHGWLSNDSKTNLIYAIKEFKPKIIVEFGSWYGKSANLIKQYSPNSILYCVDKFQPLLSEKAYVPKIYNPIDKFYVNYPRMETFVKNMSIFKNVFAITHKGIQLKAIDFFIRNKIKPDLIYIDFLKGTTQLVDFLNKFYKYSPNTVIVGDDNFLESVKKAFQIFKKQHNNLYYREFNYSYIISPRKINNYKLMLNKQKISNKIILINKIEGLLEKGNFNKVLKIIKKYNLDLNVKQNIHNNNTLYHLIAKYSFIHGKDNMKIFRKYQKPQIINNDLDQTYKDYLEYKIIFE